MSFLCSGHKSPEQTAAIQWNCIRGTLTNQTAAAVVTVCWQANAATHVAVSVDIPGIPMLGSRDSGRCRRQAKVPNVVIAVKSGSNLYNRRYVNGPNVTVVDIEAASKVASSTQPRRCNLILISRWFGGLELVLSSDAMTCQKEVKSTYDALDILRVPVDIRQATNCVKSRLANLIVDAILSSPW